MRALIWILIGLSALGFVLAVIFALAHASCLGVSPEGLSRACSNLALIAIALLLAGDKKKL